MNDSSNEESRFAPTKWYVIDSQTAKDNYNQNRSIKFETEIIKSSLFAHSDAFIVFTGDITVTGDNDTNVPFKNCATISTCKAEINDVFIDEANHTYIEMPKFNLIEYSGNYSDASGCSWKFKRDEVPADNADYSQWFKYKADLVRNTADAVNNTNSSVKKTQKLFLH